MLKARSNTPTFRPVVSLRRGKDFRTSLTSCATESQSWKRERQTKNNSEELAMVEAREARAARDYLLVDVAVMYRHTELVVLNICTPD